MRFIDKKTIRLDKEINELDKFVFKFIKILEKYTDYVIVSGYVSILLGRSRATEDIDLFIKPIDFDTFSKLYSELLKNNFWCLNAEDSKEVYSYIKDRIGTRFAENKKAIPNFEVRIAKEPLDFESFRDRLTVKTKAGDLRISSLELQVAFKKYYLKTDKDLEDAKHIETLFEDKLNKDLIKDYKKMLESKK